MDMKRIAKTFRVTAGILAIIPGTAGGSYEWPEVFPINMGFLPLLSTTDDPNHAFDTLANAGRYAIHHGNVGNMDLIKTTYPDVMTIAMNPQQTDSDNRASDVRLAETGNVWPGFWLYRAGCLLGASINTTVTQLPVENASRFTTSDYAIIYERDALGKPKFLASAADGTNGTYEFVNVTGIDTTNHILTVVRGQTGTTAKSFTAGQTAVAAFISNWEIDGKITLIRPNMSLVCPRHPVTGENWAEFAGRGRGTAVRDGLNDGTESDIVYCLAGDKADADLDLQPDGGFRDGVNVYSLGWQEHVKIVREIAGPDKIIQHDCTRPNAGYRGWKYVNGVQLETFGGGDNFSENFELLSQWVQYAEVQPAFSYGYCRAPTTTYGGVQPDNDWMFRKQFAAGLMLGMPHPYGSDANVGLFDWDEQRGGNQDDYTWLGRALGPYQRDFSGMGTGNLLAGGSWTVETSAGFASTHSGSPSDSEGIEINVTQIPSLLQGDPVYSGVVLKWNSPAISLVRGTEYTLVFEARANDTVEFGGKTYEGMPGFLRVRDFNGTIARFNVIVPSEWRTYRLAYTVPDAGGAANFKASFQLAEEASRNFRIRNIQLYTGTADRLWRDFENGTVFLNESKTESWTVNDLGTNLYWRLKGSIRPDINDGGMVGSNITVPSRDAVYLLKHDPLENRWKADLSGDWNVASYWHGGIIPGTSGGSSSTDKAMFDTALTEGRTVTVDAGRNIGGITFGNTSTNGYKLVGGGLILSNGGVIRNLAGTGTHVDTVSSTIRIAGDGGTATFINNSVGNNAGLVFGGAISGSSATGNTTTLYLDGGSERSDNIVGGIVSDGAAGGPLAVIKNGSGQWTLTGASTFKGGLTFNAGTLRYFGGKTCFGTGVIHIVSNGVTFNHANNGAMTNANAMSIRADFILRGGFNTVWSGDWDLNGGIRTVTINSNADSTVSGRISNGGLIKAGANTLMLSGANSHSGGTTVAAGTLTAAADSSLGLGNATVANGATLLLTNGVSNNYIADKAMLVLCSSSVLTLGFTGTDTIGALSLDGGTAWLTNGTYDAAALSAIGTGTYTGRGSLAVAGVAADPASTPYGWLAQYGFTDFDNDAMADADGDGLATWQEYIAGTDPTDPVSVFKITGSRTDPQGAVIRWSSAAGRFYRIGRTTNLLEAFNTVPGADRLPATPPENAYTNPAVNGPTFYRIDVWK